MVIVKDIEEVIHFTSKRKFQDIQRDGVIVPKTSPDNFLLGLNAQLRKAIVSEEYIVAIPRDSYSSWIDCGLQERLFQYTSGEVALIFPLVEKGGIFVRDHYLHSPKRLKNEHSIDVLDEDFIDSLYDSSGNPTSEGKIVEDLMKKSFKKYKREYYSSSIPLELFRGDYSCPEIWIPSKIPLSSVRRETSLERKL